MTVLSTAQVIRGSMMVLSTAQVTRGQYDGPVYSAAAVVTLSG